MAEGLCRFWQGRYKAVRIRVEESLLACAAYIDLNPIRAGMAETLEKSDYAPSSQNNRTRPPFDGVPESGSTLQDM